MANSLQFGANNTELSVTPTTTGKYFNVIVARTDGTVTYTEIYESGDKTFTDEAIAAGQAFYGTFHTVSSASGHIVAGR